MNAGFGQVNAGLARVERKLDQFIDVQSKANELVGTPVARTGVVTPAVTSHGP